MNREQFLGQLKNAVQEIYGAEGNIETLEEFPAAALKLQTPCYTAFFALVERAESLLGFWRKAQSKVIEIRSEKGAEWPRDINLVLLVGEDNFPDLDTHRRTIVDDRHVCRKFVLNLNGRDVKDVIADIPFLPPHKLIGEGLFSIIPGVEETVEGYDPRFIKDLASYKPGAQLIFEKIRDKEYDLTSPHPRDEAITKPTPISLSPRKKLSGLDIVDFRGIRRLRAKDMPLGGNIVFIYGPNGVGKTSIADAIEWVISGQVDRLNRESSRKVKGRPDPIVNLFSDGGEAQVSCSLSNRESIRRVKRGRDTKRFIGSKIVRDDHAIIDYVVGTRAPSPDMRLRIDQLRALFRGSHKLSQHDIRKFLEQDKPSERFDILTNMIGAEEFVRFRKKVADVLRRLRTEVKEVTGRNKSGKLDLEDVTRRLNARKEDHAKLRHVVTEGQNPDDIVSELLQGLRNCGCIIDKSVIERANAESIERRLELMANNVEAVIRGRKAEIEDVLIRLDSLKQELKGYVDSRAQCQRLADELANVKRSVKKENTDLQEQEKMRHDLLTELQRLNIEQSKSTKYYEGMSWLKEILPDYRLTREKLKRIESSLAGQREKIQKAESDLEVQGKSLGIKKARLKEIEQIIATKTMKGQVLVTLQKKLPQVLVQQQEVEQLSNQEKQCDLQIAELKQKSVLVREAVNEAKARLTELQRIYNDEAARHDMLSSFMAKLAEMVHLAECPLCGRNFATVEEAKNRIQEHLSAIPVILKKSAHNLEDAKKNADAKQIQADSLAAEIRTLETKKEEIRSRKTAAAKTVQEFLIDCTGSSLVLSMEEATSWEKIIETARKECETASLNSESANLRDEVKSLAAYVIEQQNILEGVRQKLLQDEQERLRLVTEVQKIETNMMERGFQSSSLPDDEYLSGKLTKAQDEVRGYVELIAKRKAKLEVVETEITVFRENIKKANEDIASKENRLRQYETGCSRFVAACRAVGVDTENPGENIDIVRRKNEKLNQSLYELEEKNRILQQIAALTRLKGEIDDLESRCKDAERQVRKNSEEESLLRKWVSCLEKLEAEVGRRQVDVVGSHLELLEPTTQRLYHRLNPHPIFGKVKIKVDEKTKELDIEARMSIGGQYGKMAVSPPEFFSDAQLNTLAITVFLAGALRQSWSRFDTILIDDPIQQMDEMNVCAFLDLIRGLAYERQFIIFTCSRDFYLLALEKLECLNKSNTGKFLAYRLEGIAPAELKVHCDAK